MTGARLENRLPTAAEHQVIAEAVGWSDAFDWSTLAASIAGSTAGVVAVVDGTVVGMGRLVGDGVKYFYVQDVAVLPAYQGAGLGAAIVDRLLDFVAQTAPSTAFVGLFATDLAAPLYSSRSFAAGHLTGMFRRVEPACVSAD